MDESNVTMTITALTKVSHFFPSNIHLESDCYLMLYEEIKKPSEVREREAEDTTLILSLPPF
jgi:hypothetical protein